MVVGSEIRVEVERGYVGISIRVVVLLVAKLDVLRKERQDREQARESSSAFDIVEELVAVVVLVVVRVESFRRRAGLGIDLDTPVDDDVE